MQMKDLLIEKQIEDIVNYLKNAEGLKKQAEDIIQIRKSKARENIGWAIVMIIFGALAFIGALPLVLAGNRLPILYLIAGVMMVLGGFYKAFTNINHVWTHSKVTFASDLEDLCRTFYTNVFCKNITDLESKDEQIIDVCQFIPVPILKNYLKPGWDTFIEEKEFQEPEAQPLECIQCHKKSEHSEIYFTSIPISTKYREEFRYEEPSETKKLIKNLYLKCQYCGSVICYECSAYLTPKTQRFLCPVCGKATNGWNGLAIRWMNLRSSMTNEDVDFSLSSVTVEKMPRCDQAVVDVTIYLNGTPFGKVTLSNVAIKADGKWFLASPEPILKSENSPTNGCT